MPPTIPNLLEQAQSAAREENWQFVNQCLQQLASLQTVDFALQEATERQTGRSRHLGWSSVLSLALAVLEAGDFQERWEVAKMIPNLGEEAIAPLLEILKDEEADVELRWFAGRILAQFDRPEVVDALIELLNTEEEQELSEMAATALATMGDGAIAALSQRLADRESRLLAVRSLAKIRSRQALEPLLIGVRDGDPQVRAAAIEALNSYDDPRIEPVLMEMVNDLSAAVRREATLGLGLCAMRTSSQSAKADLEKLLRDRLWDFNLDVCQQAAISLGRLATAPAASALFEVLESPATPIPLQIVAIRALGWMETSSALACLHRGLIRRQTEACPPEVFQEFVTVLGRIEQTELKPKAARVLIDLLQAEPIPTPLENARVKQSIALGLGRLGEKQAIAALIRLLGDLDTAVRLHAIAALKQLAPEDAYQQLAQLSRSDRLAPELKQGVAIALSEWHSHG